MNCKAVCHIYSGRPDPGWELTALQAEKAWHIWNGLNEASFREGFPSVLGYRGISITCEDGRQFFAYNEKAKAEIDNVVKWKLDESRTLEKFLLSTAPAEKLPPGLLAGL